MNILSMRLGKGLSQMELAKRVGVSLQSIRLWEKEAGKPTEENFKKLCEILGFTDGKPVSVVPNGKTRNALEEIERLKENKGEFDKHYYQEIARLEGLGVNSINVCRDPQARTTVLTKDGKSFVFNSRSEAGRFIGARGCDVIKALSRRSRIKGYTVSEKEKK